MPPTPVEAGTTFANALKAKVPGMAAQIDAILSNQDALVELGRGVLMREDHSRLMNDAAALKRQNEETFRHLQTEEARQKQWWETAQEDVELGRNARTAGWKPPATDPNNPNPAPSTRTATGNGLTPDEVNKLMTDREVGQALFVTTLTDLASKHLKRFGEVLDTNQLVREIMSDPAAKERGLVKHYEHRFSERISAADKADQDAAFDRRYKERRDLEVRESASRPPYPTGGNQGSPLDALEPVKPAAATQGVDDAVAEYNRLVEQGAAR